MDCLSFHECKNMLAWHEIEHTCEGMHHLSALVGFLYYSSLNAPLFELEWGTFKLHIKCFSALILPLFPEPLPSRAFLPVSGGLEKGHDSSTAFHQELKVAPSSFSQSSSSSTLFSCLFLSTLPCHFLVVCLITAQPGNQLAAATCPGAPSTHWQGHQYSWCQPVSVRLTTAGAWRGSPF